MSSPLYSSMVWRLGLDMLSRGSVFIINILIARQLGPSVFGKFSYLISLAQIFYAFTDLGMHLQLMKELGEGRGRKDIRWISFLEIKLILSLLCLAVGTAVASLLWPWSHPWLVPLSLLWMLSNSFLDFSQCLSNGLGDIAAARNFMVIQRILMIAGVAIPLAVRPSLESVVAGLAVGSSIGILFSFWNFYRGHSDLFHWSWNAGEWKGVIKRSLPVGISAALGQWYLRVGIIILGWVAAAETMAHYSAAFRLYEITYIVPAAIMNIGLPHLSHVYKNNPEGLAAEFAKLTRMVVMFGGAWALLLFFGGHWIVRLLFGESYLGAVPVLKIFSVAGFFVFLNYLITHMMIVFGYQKRHALHLTITFVVCFLLNVLWVPAYGAKGPAWVLLAGEILTFSMTFWVLFRRNRGNFLPGGFGTIPPYDPA